MTEGYGAVKIKTYIVHMSPESYSHFQERKFLPEFRICPIFKLKYMSPDSYSHAGRALALLLLLSFSRWPPLA